MEAEGLNRKKLEEVARQIRCDVLRMIHQAGSGHPGGSLSIVDILVVLYYEVMRIDPNNPRWEDRDRLILSKGHACPALYAVLARRGYFELEHLSTLRRFGSMLQGHPDSKRTPGIEISTGSLGQGLSVGVGMALGARLAGKHHRVYVLLGDGECDEGQVWEAALSAAHYKLDNLIAIVDDNGVQLDGPVKAVMDLGLLANKWEAFGWDVATVDGHSFSALIDCFNRPNSAGRPRAVIARTVKGRGVSFMEGRHEWHGGSPTDEQLRAALQEIMGEDSARQD
ncbi:MAG: transketolase [Bacillota bacterium]